MALRRRRTLDRLRTAYGRHKGDFALGRYEELKTMIKTAVKDSNLAVEVNRDHRGAAMGASSGSGAASRTASSVGGLRERAAEFAQQQSKTSAEEKMYSGMKRALDKSLFQIAPRIRVIIAYN